LLNKRPNGSVIPFTEIAGKRVSGEAQSALRSQGVDMARQKEIISDNDFSENFETQESVRENNRKVRHREREKFRVMRTKALLLAALRLWELKNPIDE